MLIINNNKNNKNNNINNKNNNINNKNNNINNKNNNINNKNNNITHNKNAYNNSNTSFVEAYKGLGQNNIDPMKSSPPNEFMMKLYKRMHVYEVISLEINEDNRESV
jgi:hypothetical protein